MSNSPALEIGLIAVLVFFAGLLRLAEVAVTLGRKSSLKAKADSGDLKSQLALELSENPEKLETLIHILRIFILVLIGAHIGSYSALRVGRFLGEWWFLGTYGFLLGFLGIVFLSSLLILVFSEIFPKRLATAYPESLARLVSPGLKTLNIISSPLVEFLEFITDSMCKIFGIECKKGEIVTEEEVKEMIREGTDMGVFEQAEEQMVNKVLKLGDKTAAALMTPRNNIIWLDVTKDPHELLNEAYESGHNNFVAAKEALDTILGIVSIADLSQFVLQTEGKGDMQEIIREPLVVSNHLSALKVLEQMRETKKHLALVVDDYGGLDGVVTTHDLIEAVVGELDDEDEEEASIVQRSDDSFLVDATFDIDEMLENLEIAPIRDIDKRGYHSLGGFILSQLGHIPKAGEKVHYGGYVFEVVDMDRNRIDKILVKKTA